MTPETEATLVTQINLLVTLVQRMDENIKAQGERIARMEGRLDEQSRILAALIPTRVAAIPAQPAA